MSSPREYRDHVTECLDSAKAATSDAERQVFLDMAKAWLETAVQAVIPTDSQVPTASQLPTASQQPAEPPPAGPAAEEFSVAACANDNEASLGDVAGGTAAIAPSDDVMADEFHASEATASETAIAEPLSGKADGDERDRGNGGATGADQESPIQWNVVLDAALCPWGPSTSSYWPR